MSDMMLLTLKSLEDFIKYLSLKPPLRKAVFRKPANDVGMVEYKIFLSEEQVSIATGIFVQPTQGLWLREEKPGYLSLNIKGVTKRMQHAQENTSSEIPALKKFLLTAHDVPEKVTGPIMELLLAELSRRNMAEATWKTQVPPYDVGEARRLDIQNREEMLYPFTGNWKGKCINMSLELSKTETTNIVWHVQDIGNTFVEEADIALIAAGYTVFS